MSRSHPFPLGAHPRTDGTRFAVECPGAERVQLCLVDDGKIERRVELERTQGVWHGVVDGVGPDQHYGYRVHGPAHDPAKLLLDPAARRISGVLGDAEVLATTGADTLGHVPVSVVTAPPRPPAPAPAPDPVDAVVYEVHVGAATATHPAVPPELRGTYLGLAHPVVVAHLVALGVTVVELLPVQAFLDEPGLRARGMRNHWGYAPAAFSAPHPGYASRPGAEQEEVQTLVDALHAAGIAVWVDVVYNHTCEGGPDGPVIGFRGYGGYYLPDGHDLTGCGNTLDAGSPLVVRMVLDSLRHWASMGVDGFRFDLASVLGRPRGGAFDPAAGLLTAITTDPVLARCTLVAEPWDATGDGYQVGAFGPQWTEWNDYFRDTVRDFWRGAAGRSALAVRLAGSQDVVGARSPTSSLNFVTAHDGFTVRDLVSYSRKHNDANGEQGRDGTDGNRSVNHGVEGATDDPAVLAARAQHVRSLLGTLLLAAGTPMLLAGDELGHTQGGNNNAYCGSADDPTAWALDWAGADPDLTAFVGRVLALRRAGASLRRDTFYDPAELSWSGADGAVLAEHGWRDDDDRVLQAWVPGTGVLLVVNGGPTTDVVLAGCGVLQLVLDGARPTGEPTGHERHRAGDAVTVTGGSLSLWRAA